MTTPSFPFKDPNEVLDYTLDWTSRLGVDTIQTSNWSISAGSGLVIDSQSVDGTNKKTTVWLSGGTENISYTLLNRVVTAGGRTMDQSVKLKVKSK